MVMMKSILCAFLLSTTLACAATIPPVQDFYVDGIHVLLRNDIQNNVVSAILYLQGGCINLRGLNPLLETYALAVPASSGPTTMTKEQYRQQTAGLSMVINTNAGRDYSDMTCVCVKDYWDTSWKIFSDIALHPRYDTTEFERIRRTTIININSRPSSPDEYVGFLTDSLFFRNHLYYNPATVEETNALTLDSIEAYHNTLFIKARMLLVVVGNITKDDLTAKIHESLGTLPEGVYYDFGFRQPAQCDTSEFVTRYMKLPTFYIEGYFGAPKETDFDYWASVVTASMLSSRMFEELRTKRNLTYAASAEIVGGKLCYGKVYLTTEYPDTCLALIREQVGHMMKYPPSQTEINYHINLWITQLGLREETNISQADAIGVAQITTGAWTNAYTIIDRLHEVYPSDIVRCAQRYFRNINFAVLGDTTKPIHVGNYLW